MKKIILLLFLFILFIGCESKKEILFDSFVFSDGGLHHSYSLKFSNSDTIYLERQFPTPTEHFYSIISSVDKDSVNEIIKRIEFSKYNSTYFQDNLSDGNTFQFFKMNNDSAKSIITVYGDKAPEKLYDFYSAFRNLKEKQKFIPIKTNQNFGDLKYFLPPPPPPPMLNK